MALGLSIDERTDRHNEGELDEDVLGGDPCRVGEGSEFGLIVLGKVARLSGHELVAQRERI